MNLKNRILVTAVAVFVSLIIFITPLSAKEIAQKPTIAASTFSLYDISKNIAGESAEVFMILPFGVDVHSYEPSPKEMIKISKSDLVLYSGAGLEPWIGGFKFKNRAIDISKYVELKKPNGEHEHHGDVHHKHNSVDPHYWQDLQNMIKATERITEELAQLFPQNKSLYIKNRDNYINMLKNLDADYKKKLSACKLDTIIVNHDAFSYLANRYGFHVEALSGLSPEAEPSPKNMIKLITHVKEHKVATIFFESFASDKAIKSIAKEANVKVDILQPLGNITADEAKSGLSYEDIMRKNLQKISQALECK
ncbi:MAG: metal ABC transporter substrate-binding protein [Sulfurimonas sp.]|uniref:metal ABC transporter substrate-binding protein n=1 Tax=Sulfurimonas sp. TaxID=2022749 RepID=UPI00261A866D|nr:metal ABC transporter substrate-binding protein [Sulfurimonas sp.]MDD5400465.1 metal ABC transporter substrate-binding protein [Sulfurimonas sp.]